MYGYIPIEDEGGYRRFMRSDYGAILYVLINEDGECEDAYAMLGKDKCLYETRLIVVEDGKVVKVLDGWGEW